MYLCTGSLCTLDENQGIGYNLKAVVGSVPGGLHGLQHCLMLSFTAASLLVPRAGLQYSRSICSSRKRTFCLEFSSFFSMVVSKVYKLFSFSFFCAHLSINFCMHLIHMFWPWGLIFKSCAWHTNA